MALARVQATPKATATGVASVSATFTTPPTVGNGIVVAVLSTISAALSSSAASDNRGNAYALAQSVAVVIGGGTQAVYYCPAITASGGPFTVTVAPAAGTASFVLVAIEVSGVGSGLAVEQTASGGAAIGTAPQTPSMSAPTATDIFELAVLAVAAAQTSIVVTAATPPWTQEIEELSLAPYFPGEIDWRTRTGTGLSAPAIAWTISTQGWYEVAAVVFKATPAAATEARVSQAAIETLSQPVNVAARVSQDVVETLSQPTAVTARVSQRVVEVLSATVGTATPVQVTQQVIELLTQIPPTPARVTQSLVELLGQSSPLATRATQLAVEVFQAQAARTRTTQVAVEVFFPIMIQTRTTQLALEYFRADPARLRVTQEAVELFLFLPPCVNGDFPIDPE